MILKSGVDIAGIKPELIIGLMIADSVFTSFDQRMVVTSVTDGQHMKDSLHYEGLAADIRLPQMELRRAIFNTLSDFLGNDWDLIQEPDHIHIEYDPD